jgi:hypothetical protein
MANVIVKAGISEAYLIISGENKCNVAKAENGVATSSENIGSIISSSVACAQNISK